MSQERAQSVAVIGAGLVGSLLACYLGRRGYSVSVYERRPDPRKAGAERGRSINLALSERGLAALRQISLIDEVMGPALPMHGRMIHTIEGRTTFSSYSASGQRAINSIGRGTLNQTLLDAAERTPGVSVVFDARLVEYDVASHSLSLSLAGRTTQVSADIVLGADGAGSALRTSLADVGRVAVATDTLDVGYKELTIPARDGEFALNPDALHIWPRGGAMMIALPNPDRSFTCTLFWPSEGGFDADEAQIVAHFTSVYPDAVALMPDLVSEFQHNPVGSLATIHSDPWQVDGRVAILGDAAHAILPFFGQGANCGFEDVVELDRCLDETVDDWNLALPLFQQRRQGNAEAIAWLAADNFVEMRDRVSSRRFRVTKGIGHALERVLPGRYLSRYEMVSFTTIPYADVIERARRQNRVTSIGAVAIGAAVLTTAVLLVRGGRRATS